MKKILLIAVAFVATATLAVESTKANPDEIAERRRQARMRSGGQIVKPGSSKGSIAFVNAQSRMSEADIRKVMETLDTGTRFVFQLVKTAPSTPDKMKAATSSDFAVIVVDDDKNPAMLVAPEDRWAMVNVRKLDVGLATEEGKKMFLAARYRKELLRAFSLLCGGGLSMYPSNAFEASSIQGLDTAHENVPMDMVQNYNRFLTSAGLRPKVVATYKRACISGWAPAPTNDLQKAIWDEIQRIRTENEAKAKK